MCNAGAGPRLARPRAAPGEVQIGEIRRSFCTGGVVRHWPRLRRAVVESPSLEGFKHRVGMALRDVVWQAWWGWGDGWTW